MIGWPATETLVVLLAVVLATLSGVLIARRRRRSEPPVAAPTDVPPALHLRTAADDVHAEPALIAFPPPGRGRLRIGYHPPFMDRHVGRNEFGGLAFVDVRGDAPAARELSRHAACIWREASGDCFVQLGWPGPGESIRPRNQTRVLRLGRPHDATSQPFRLAHRDVLRLSSNVEYVFLEVEAMRDRPTPEQRKIDAFEAASMAPSSGAKLSLLRRAPARGEADDDDLG